MRWGGWRWPVAIVVSVALCAGFVVATWQPKAAHAASPTWWSTDRALAYQIDAAHAGAVNHDSLTPPLIGKWSKTFANTVSYPVIADGRVFVSVQNPSQVSGDDTYALDAATGNVLWGPINTFASRPGTGMAYDRGRLFVLIYDGVLDALDPATGAVLWSAAVGTGGWTGPPTAFGGMVFAAGFGPTGKVVAVDEASGGVVWSGSIASGDHSSPAVSWNGVYTSVLCNDATHWDPVLGTLLWHHAGCGGGPGRTPVLYGGKLYSRSNLGNAILDATTGSQTGTFSATFAPAFSGNTGYFITVSATSAPNTLTAVDLTSGTTLWTYTGDGHINSAPVVSNGVVYVGSSGAGLYALNAVTGVPLSGSPYAIAGILSPNEDNSGVELTGFGAGEGWLDIPAGPTLYAFTSALDVSPGDLLFPMQATGTSSAPAPVTITNYGGASATLSGFGTSGDFSQTNTCSSPLSPGASCGANVTFTPTASGMRTGTLTFNDSVTGAHTVFLTGNAQSLFPPSQVRKLAAIPGVTSVRLSWLPPVYTGGSVTGYTVLESPGGTTTVGSSTTSMMFNGLTVGTTYSFQVTANTTNGNSPTASTSALISLGFQDEIITQAGAIGIGPATQIGQQPYAVAVSATGGHLYVGDAANPVLRDVNLSTGKETGLAGNDGYGYSGDGGSASAAMIFSASAFAVCGSSTYFADLGNYVIRKVDAVGTITSIAGNGLPGYSGDGGPATAAELSIVLAIACKSGGGLYVADTDNGAVRVVSPTGNITTLQRGFSLPTGLAEIRPGTVDVSDSGQDNAVWQLSGQTAPVLIAGTPGAPAGFSGDGGPATSAVLSDPRGLLYLNGKLYIADAANNRVRVVANNGIISTFAGSGGLGFGGDGGQATSASMSFPTSLAADANKLYIADFDNNRVRAVDWVTTVITTIAGNGTFSYSGDTGPATSAQLGVPSATAFDSLGNEYVADLQNNVVRRIATNGVITTFAGTTAQGFGGDGGPATSAVLNAPRGVVVNSVGDVYVSDWGNNRIRKVDHVTGFISTVAGNGSAGFNGDGAPATNFSLNAPRGLAVDGSDNVYIADSHNNRVRVFSPNSNSISTTAGSNQTGLGDGGPASQATLNLPTAVAFDSAGSLYIADARNNRVRKVDRSGVITTVAGSGAAGAGGDGGPAIQAPLNTPGAVAFDASGNLYIAEEGNNRVRFVDSRGVISTVVGTCGTINGWSGDGGVASTGQLNTPIGLAFDALGDLFISDIDNNRIRETSSLVGFRGAACANAPGSASSRTGASPSPPRNSGTRLDNIGGNGLISVQPPTRSQPWSAASLKSPAKPSSSNAKPAAPLPASAPAAVRPAARAKAVAKSVAPTTAVARVVTRPQDLNWAWLWLYVLLVLVAVALTGRRRRTY